MADAVTIDDIRTAAGRIAATALATPLLSHPELDARVGGRVFLKCENLQRTGSFKFRGAMNAVSAVEPGARARGIVACSSGNHAQGIAEAARLFGVPATIVMPADAPAPKREGTARRGATVRLYDRTGEDRDAIAAELVAESGATLVHPFNHPHVIAGQGTIGLEIAAECARRDLAPDAILVPCSGGGLAAGIGVAAAALLPSAAVFVAEPAGFDDYGRSLAADAIESNAALGGSVCDALLAPRPGPIGFALNRRNLAGGVAADDDEALAAVAFAFETLRMVVEPGGAVGLAALLAGRIDAAGKTIVVVLSGGNIDPPVLDRALGRA
ncbi:threonine ammonia-lyase [Prosthecomicrobium pneumaticum]|uniref:Threonine dehydratase n=1 Tax=Prosthecomicrobium pneumaticum TaxID=81895 RepID=A0A7W9L3Z1_9HYPH|nr:threonine/serine dehydratase [Prosthecomicrobium pneumaticum]MBB5755047.1 threonine dehydratase [Prosthecomicrobium pneumaticum]